jgi:Tol biopolymer transport system component
MTLSAGTRLGPYEVLSPIGAGGMGEVYRAKDTRLGREVAVKVLPASYSEDADRLRRFEQEAKAASLLNHANITAVYDVGSHDGAPYVVSELLEGETLRASLVTGKLSPRRAVDYAIGIARGLAAAHEKGIVHRDLKPENLFVTHDGNVKILDFGLAKLTQPTGIDSQTNLPTVTPGTEPGVVLGTLGYMSPEQVRGKGADHRSDIFAFGAILYEMLSGRRAFQGDSAADTMSAILKEDPPELSVTNESVSPALDRIVRHCLEKAPERRLHSAHDLAFELETLTQTSGVAAAPPARRTSRLLWLALGAAALIAIAAAALWLGREGTHRGGGNGQARTFRRMTDLTGNETFPALSPDGQTLAFGKRSGGNEHVYIQRAGGQNPTDLTADCDRDSTAPAFSPDGNLIAYTSQCEGGGLFLVGATGESARKLAPLGSDPAWSPDGHDIVFDTESHWLPYSRSGNSELWIAEVASGKTRKIYAGDALQPSVSPRRLRIAYWALPPDGSQRDIWTIPYGGLRNGEKPIAVTQDAAVDWNPVWSTDGRFLYFLSDRDGTMNLWRVPIDEATGKPLGPPEPRTLPTREVAGFGISRDGRRLAYVAAEPAFSLETLAIDPAGEARGRPVEILQTSQPIAFPNPSPDGTLVTFCSQGAGREDVFLIRADGTKLRRLTDDEARDRASHFLPDGKRIVFHSNRGGRWELWTIRPDGSGLAQLSKTALGVILPVPSPDGRRIAASDGADVWIFEAGAAGPVEPASKLPRPPSADYAMATDWTPDGRELVCTFNRRDATTIGLGVFSFERKAWESWPIEAKIAGSRANVGYAILAGANRVVFSTAEGVVSSNIAGGPTRLLAPHPANGKYGGYGVTRDGRTLYLMAIHDNGDIWMATPP